LLVRELCSCVRIASAPYRRVSGRFAQLIIVALLGALAMAPEAFAETPADASLMTEQLALFDRMRKQPTNLDVAFRYAEVSTKLPDFEAAIGALERMLFFNASLARVNLELGVLYFRLGSYEMAKTYFTNAIADPTSGEREPAIAAIRVASSRWHLPCQQALVNPCCRARSRGNYRGASPRQRPGN
jgi:tetratricopeptide (TPR) repeat protein